MSSYPAKKYSTDELDIGRAIVKSGDELVKVLTGSVAIWIATVSSDIT